MHYYPYFYLLMLPISSHLIHHRGAITKALKKCGIEKEKFPRWDIHKELT